MNFDITQNLYLKPNVQCELLRGELSERWPGHENGTLLSEISALINEDIESSLSPSAMQGYSSAV